jgi:hypothetical protein
MDDIDRQVPDLIHGLGEITGAVIAEWARAQSGVTTRRVFQKQWPGVSASGAPTWRMLSEESAGPRPPQGDPALDKVREGG